MTPALLVIAKEPVPGRVKTRLCPPCTYGQAAAVAEAALQDTLDVATRSGASGRTLVLSGTYRPPAGWSVLAQRGDGLGERLANAFLDALASETGASDDVRPGLLIGMDTPQVTPELLAALGRSLDRADAVLGLALDGGWWALGLRDPRAARVLATVPMSTPDTGRLTIEALCRSGLRIVRGPTLRDVDTADDAHQVARTHPGGRFAAAVAAHVPTSAAGHSTVVPRDPSLAASS
jgi:glycosyltransferase A (GT-A) superfamily protein (DUF2064 family)